MGLIPFGRFPSDAGTASASSVAGAGYAAANVQKQTVQKVWKSDDIEATAFHDTDFGSAVDIDTFACWGHDFLETDTITLSYADDAAQTVNVVTPAVTWREIYLFETFSQITKRHRRLSILKTVAATNKQAGRIVDGTSTELEFGLKTPGDVFGPGKTTSTKKTTSGGQQYGNLGVSSDVMRGNTPGLLADDIAELLELIRTYQTVTPFVAVIRKGKTNQSAIYGTFDSMVTPKYVSETRQEIAWRMTEQK